MIETNERQMWYAYEVGSNEVAPSLHQYIKTLDQNQSAIQQNNLRHLKLYNNMEIVGLSIANYVMSTQSNYSSGGSRHNRISLNVIKSCIDTVVAKVAKNKIKPTFLTDKGSWEMQNKAQQLTKFTTGVFYQTKVPQTSPMTLRDSLVFGTGLAKVCSDENNQIITERAFPDEIMVDMNEAYYGDPRTMYQRKFVSKQTLHDLWKHDEEKAKKIKSAKIVNMNVSSPYADCLLIVEAWRLPSTKKSDDGRHTIAIENCVIVDEKWEDDEFPFAVMRYTKPTLGFFGAGIAEELIGVQIEINRLCMHIQQSMRLVSNPRVFIESGSQVNVNQLTNDIGGVVNYVGQPPIIQAAQAVHPELFQQLENYYRKAFEIVGVSQLSAQSQKPSGLDSGRALREFNDIETERFAMTGQMYEDFHLDLARLQIKQAKRLAEKGVNYEAKAFSRKDGMEVIKWNEVNLDEDSYVMQVFPASALPSQPGARLQTIGEMINSGMVDPEMGQELLDFPDIDAKVQLLNSPTRVILKTLEHMIKTGKYITPEPYNNLELAVKYAQLYYQDSVLMDIPDSRLELLRRYIDDCGALIQKMMPPPPPQAPAQQLLESQLAAQPLNQVAPEAALPQFMG